MLMIANTAIASITIHDLVSNRDACFNFSSLLFNLGQVYAKDITGNDHHCDANYRLSADFGMAR